MTETELMEIYNVYFAVLLLFVVALAYHHSQAEKHAIKQNTIALPASGGSSAATKFKWEYFGVYALVVAADWLQGPYMYTLYKDEKGIDESTVAALFATGFVVAGITAFFVGSLADQHGRKAACLTFCVTYATSCLSVLSNHILILFAGRALGGLSTTLLYSVFETWMISEYHDRDLTDCLSLGSMFSSSVMLSSIVAIIAGVVGEVIVMRTETKTSPFMAAIVLLAAAFVCIQQKWNENYGEGASTTEKPFGSFGEIRSLLGDSRIVALGLTTTLFEGSMYLFVFFWSPALISSRILEGKSSSPPFGVIFSCFMCAMMLGSLVSAIIQQGGSRDAARLMLSILALASYAVLIPVIQRNEGLTFWSFALFEVCVGLYFPTTSRLKLEMVDDAVRAQVYSLMRLPLNFFVVAALGATKDGDAHRGRMSTVTGTLLLLAFWVVKRYLL